MTTGVRCRSSRHVSLVAVTVAGSTAWQARRGVVGPREERIFRWFNGGHDALHGPAWLVMQLGSLGAVAGASAELARRRRGRDAVVVGLCGTALWAGLRAGKPVVGRGRPEDHLADVVVRGQRQTGLGFPSGHAAVAVFLALTPAHQGSSRAAGLGVAALVGAARMYVGAHLPLDVAGGAAIGALASRGAARFARALAAGRC